MNRFVFTAPHPVLPADSQRADGVRTVARLVGVLVAVVGFSVGLLVPASTAAAVARSPQQRGSATLPTVPAYWLAASDGGVFALGGTPYYGSADNLHLQQPVVGMTPTADAGGYWLVAADGGVFSYGDAHFYGSAGDLKLNKPVVGMARTPDGKGYWLVAADGGVFSYGDASFYGSTGSMKLQQPVVGMASTIDGKGYWLVAADGGVFAFGDARFWGSTGNLHLQAPVTGMAAFPGGGGYLLVGADGGVFAFGWARFLGSMGGVHLTSPVVSIAYAPGGKGYWMTAQNGNTYAFGTAGYFGSAPDDSDAVVGIAEGPGSGYPQYDPYLPRGSYGFDVSGWQCGTTLPTSHAIGVVEVDGASFGYVNSCLAQQAAWAGSGLNLYTFLTYGTTASGPAACSGDEACNYGFAATQYAYGLARTAGVDTNVTWWLDIEDAADYWSQSATENAALIKGALLGLEDEGIADVGIYSNPYEWSSITGGSGYSPVVPEWVAEWGSNTPPFDPGQYCSGYAFAAGPTWMVQFTDGANTDNLDNDYSCP